MLDPALVQRAVEVSSKGEEGKIFFRFFSVFFPLFWGGLVQRAVGVSSEQKKSFDKRNKMVREGLQLCCPMS